MPGRPSKSVRTEFKPAKPLQGISKHQIDDHFDVKYSGYVNCFNQIEERKGKTQPSGGPNFSEWREMMLEQERCFNAITLHEGYFQCLGGDGQPGGMIKNWLQEDFGSFDRWKEEFMATGASARGWCVLAFSLSDGHLFNTLCDEHMTGLWNSVPLVILDMYEHAYYIDYNANSKQYLQAYQNNLSFDFANRSIETYGLEGLRKKMLALMK